ncbi:MAG: hypothetical protein AB7E79_05545 [Rhodospirillaceae bacterium]
MSVSTNRRHGARWAAIAGLLISSAAFAQNAPVSLLPAQTPPAAPDAGPAPAPLPDDAVPAEESSAPSITASALDAPSMDRIGLIDAASGGFSADMWRGTDLELLRRVLPQLPRRMDSLAQRRLARALLLSAAAPPPSSVPAGPPVVGVEGASPVPPAPAAQWLLETRLIGLAAIGNWDDALALMDLIPADQMTDGLRKLRADGSLITGRTNVACGEAATALGATGDPYWQKVQIYCNFANNQPSAASLGLSVLREQGVQDPLFYWTVDLLNGNRRLSPPNPGRPEPVHLMMLAKAGGPVPDALIQTGDPTTLAVVSGIAPPPDDKADKTPAAQRAERRKLAEESRVVVAERAVGAGTLDAERLRLLYRQLNVKDEAPPPLASITVATVRERVHLFQTALAQTVPAARAEVIARAIDLTRADRGRNGPDLITVGRIYAPLILEINATPDLIWFSGPAARVLLAAGELDKGREWLELARSMARTSIEAGQVADGLWPIDRLMTEGTPGRLPPQALQAWRETVPQDRRAEYHGLLLNILAAVGEPITSADWLPAMDSPAPPVTMAVTPPRVVNGLKLAQQDMRVGETVVFALLALGEDGPSSVEPAALQDVIAALMSVGREHDARALAVEALLVEGL